MNNRRLPALILTVSMLTASLLSGVSTASATTLTQVKATWSGDGAEPGIKEFADIACVEKGYTNAIKFDPTPASGAYEEDGKIISYMEFKSVDCK